MKLIHGDCLVEMPKLESSSVDMILCDLPYGQTNLKWDSQIPLEPLWKEYLRIAKPNAAIVLFGKQPFTSLLVQSQLDIFRYELIWEKSRAGNSMQVKRQPSAIHENILVFYREQPTYNEVTFTVDEKYVDKRKSIRDSFYSKGHYKGVMVRKEDTGIRHPQSILPFGSVWHKGMHPTEKPVDLLEWLIRTYSNEGDTILDSCAGSGSTGIAAQNLNRDFVLIEKDPDYFARLLTIYKN